MTRDQVLRCAIAFALRRARKIIRGLKTSWLKKNATPSPITSWHS